MSAEMSKMMVLSGLALAMGDGSGLLGEKGGNHAELPPLDYDALERTKARYNHFVVKVDVPQSAVPAKARTFSKRHKARNFFGSAQKK